MKVFAPLALLIVLAFGCKTSGSSTPGDDSAAARDTNWMADLRMTAVDTTVRLCGSGKRYRLVGPAMDTIITRYGQANTLNGQWMKIWFIGHVTAVANGEYVDSAMYARSFMHLDASLSCDPVPDPRIVGRYKLASFDPTHPRSVVITLSADGTATMDVDLYDGRGVISEEGRWGVDVADHVNIKWPKRDQTMLYRWDGINLKSELPGATGSADLIRQPDAASQ